MKIVLRAFALGGPDVLMWADDALIADPGELDFPPAPPAFSPTFDFCINLSRKLVNHPEFLSRIATCESDCQAANPAREKTRSGGKGLSRGGGKKNETVEKCHGRTRGQVDFGDCCGSCYGDDMSEGFSENESVAESAEGSETGGFYGDMGFFGSGSDVWTEDECAEGSELSEGSVCEADNIARRKAPRASKRIRFELKHNDEVAPDVFESEGSLEDAPDVFENGGRDSSEDAQIFVSGLIDPALDAESTDDTVEYGAALIGRRVLKVDTHLPLPHTFKYCSSSFIDFLIFEITVSPIH